MENSVIINELTQGRELAAQLKGQLDSLTSPEICEPLLEKILSSYEKALTLLNFKLFFGAPNPMDSPLALLGNNSNSNVSPISEVSDGDSSKEQCQVLKKRKTSPQWSKQVRVCSATGMGGELDDGHSWRKYGQKDILGANHPRAYYRCTHRNTQGCLATKQVQRCDGDSCIVEVTYKGRHSCKASHPAAIISAENARPKAQFQLQQTQAHNLVLNYGLNQKLVTSEEEKAEHDVFPAFSFPLAPIKCETADKENTMLERCSPPPFTTPSTSESMYLSFFTDQNGDGFGLDQILDRSESDLTDHRISTPTSVMNSPFLDLDLPADQAVLDATDISHYFS